MAKIDSIIHIFAFIFYFIHLFVSPTFLSKVSLKKVCILKASKEINNNRLQKKGRCVNQNHEAFHLHTSYTSIL